MITFQESCIIEYYTCRIKMSIIQKMNRYNPYFLASALLAAFLVLSGCSAEQREIPLEVADKPEIVIQEPIKSPDLEEETNILEIVIQGPDATFESDIEQVDHSDWSSTPSNSHKPEDYLIPSVFSLTDGWQIAGCKWIDVYKVLTVYRSPSEICIVLYDAEKGKGRILYRLVSDAPIGPIQVQSGQIHIGHIILDASDYRILQKAAPSIAHDIDLELYSYAYNAFYRIQGNDLVYSAPQAEEIIIDTASPGEFFQPMGWSPDGDIFAYWKTTANGKRQELRAANTRGNICLTVHLDNSDCKAYWSDDDTVILLKYPGRITIYSTITGDMQGSTTLFPQDPRLAIQAVYYSQVAYTQPDVDGSVSLYSWNMTGIGKTSTIMKGLQAPPQICFAFPGSMFIHTEDSVLLHIERICY